MKLPMDYNPAYACKLERGWVLAFAHVRGGGEKGRTWHASGKALDKWNSFWDLEVRPPVRSVSLNLLLRFKRKKTIPVTVIPTVTAVRF